MAMEKVSAVQERDSIMQQMRELENFTINAQEIAIQAENELLKQRLENLRKVKEEQIKVVQAGFKIQAEHDEKAYQQIEKLNQFKKKYNLDISQEEIEKLKEQYKTEEDFLINLAGLQEKLISQAAEDKQEALRKEFETQLNNIKQIEAEQGKIDKKKKRAEKAEKRTQNRKKLDEKREGVKKATQEGKKKGGLLGGLGAFFKASAQRHTSEEYDGGAKGAAKAGLNNALGAASDIINAVSDFAKKFDKQIDEIGAYKGQIDTRLQGSSRDTYKGSYWDQMSKDITGVAGVSPLVKQESIVKNLQTMVDKGISFNVEQRAFLETVKEKIATTFDANNGTLLRLVRIQQADSTAARLGMESMMTTFLNGMYENTEYLKDVATSVKSSLEESMAMMSAVDAVGFEYQVQKWIGSLYSVGMSQSSVQSIADAFGKLAAGDISALGSDGAGNLIVMAANKANLSIADMLASGLDESDTNKLLAAVIDYLGEISEQTADSHVVRQQLAKVYGMKGSDLVAAANLTSSRNTIYNSGSNYNRSLQQLYDMSNTMYSRTSIGEMMQNAWSNAQYSMSAGIANNPALYAMYKAAGLLDAVAGGGNILSTMAAGFGVDLNTSIADLMRFGALGGGIFSSIGQMISMGSGGGTSGTGMLKALGIQQNSISTLTRGNFNGSGITSGMTVSESTMVGNASGSDIQNSTMAGANETKETALSAAKEDSTEITVADVNENVVRIAVLLEQVASGEAKLHVHQDNIAEAGPWSGVENVLGGIL